MYKHTSHILSCPYTTHRCSYPSDGVLAFLAHGGHTLLIAWFAVRLVSLHHKGLVAQLLVALCTYEVLWVPEPAQSRSIRAPRQVDKKQDGGDELERSVREREEGRGGFAFIHILRTYLVVFI